LLEREALDGSLEGKGQREGGVAGCEPRFWLTVETEERRVLLINLFLEGEEVTMGTRRRTQALSSMADRLARAENREVGT